MLILTFIAMIFWPHRLSEVCYLFWFIFSLFLGVSGCTNECNEIKFMVHYIFVLPAKQINLKIFGLSGFRMQLLCVVTPFYAGYSHDLIFLFSVGRGFCIILSSC